MPVLSAGLLVHRAAGEVVEVLLAHPGGPFWARRDLGAWSIPKGEYSSGDDPREAARREFAEEVGSEPPSDDERFLGDQRQRSGKIVSVWSVRGEVDPEAAGSNLVEMEWPRGSGQRISFPEVDRVEWFSVAEARRRLLEAQVVFLDRLLEALASDGAPASEGVARSDGTARE